MAQFEPRLIRHPQCIVSHADSVLEPTEIVIDQLGAFWRT
jgi:hypothetical protein